MDRIRSIVVPTDFSELSEAAAQRAFALSELDGAEIHLVHTVRSRLAVAPYEISIPATVWEGVRAAARKQLEDARRALVERGAKRVSAELSELPDAVAAIAAAVEAHDADLVVMGTHGRRGLKHAFLGSTTERSIRALRCPVLSVKGAPRDGQAPITRILLPTDFSGPAENARAEASGLARRLGASLDVMHVIEPMAHYATALVGIEEEIRASANKHLARVADAVAEAKVEARTHLLEGSPAEAIVQAAETLDADLIVMGTRGNTGLGHVLLGSVAERTLRLAPCPVLTVKAPELAER